jgi:tRNA threonylcarbamoyladenosine modification (KEOPS) complex  Pcc1 subunit
MMQGVLVYEHPKARLILDSLRPDNTSEIRMKLSGDRITIVVKAKSLRTLLATCDDLLVNLQIAEETLSNY